MEKTTLSVFVVFLVGSIPLVWQDLRTLSVSSWWLILTLLTWVVTAVFLTPDWVGLAAMSAFILALGAIFLVTTPHAMGTADILYMSGLAWLLPFWGLLVALGLSCCLGIILYLSLSNLGSRDVRSLAIPFLPCLSLGGLAVLGGGL